MSSINPDPTTLQARAATPHYAAQALEAIVQIPSAVSPPELLARLMLATVAIGASASLYTAAIPGGGREPSCFSLFACHPAFAQAQESQLSLLSHPWFRFARTHTLPGTDHQIRIEHGADAAALKLAQQYGFRSCLIVPIPNGRAVDRLEMLCLGSSEAGTFEGAQARVVRTLARSLAAELHDWLTSHLRQRLTEAAQLQESDVDLLAMAWRGLGSKDIAGLTGMSTASVNSRFQRINGRLNCPSRKASAMRAAAYGLLEPV